MMENISHCRDLVEGFCGAVVESGGLDILHLLYSSSLWLEFVYAMVKTILSINTTGKSGGGREGGRRV